MTSGVMLVVTSGATTLYTAEVGWGWMGDGTSGLVGGIASVDIEVSLGAVVSKTASYGYGATPQPESLIGTAFFAEYFDCDSCGMPELIGTVNYPNNVQATLEVKINGEVAAVTTVTCDWTWGMTLPSVTLTDGQFGGHDRSSPNSNNPGVRFYANPPTTPSATASLGDFSTGQQATWICPLEGDGSVCRYLQADLANNGISLTSGGCNPGDYSALTLTMGLGQYTDGYSGYFKHLDGSAAATAEISGGGKTVAALYRQTLPAYGRSVSKGRESMC